MENTHVHKIGNVLHCYKLYGEKESLEEGQGTAVGMHYNFKQG